jgi:type VI secretion system protein ImpE
MVAKQLFDAGKVREAEQALSAWLRDHPTDVQQRIFLFELLCFSGQFDRAEKQLSVLTKENDQAQLGAILDYSALHAEKTRHELFQQNLFPTAPASAAPVSGLLNGKPFRSIRDADPDIGARLEIFAAGAYLWLPLEHVSSLRLEAPRRLRDTLWATAYVKTAPSFKEKELGEIMIPVIYPFSWKCDDPEIWLGRSTAWFEDEAGKQYPLGQKTLLVDDEEVSLLEVRSLELNTNSAATETK